MPVLRPCLDCGTPAPASRCATCNTRRNAGKEAQRNPLRKTLYDSAYRKEAKLVRENATVCWVCGEGPRATDPWQADHVRGGDPSSPLLPAHRSCNSRRANRRRKSES